MVLLEISYGNEAPGRYRIKIQYELLNDMLQHYGIDNLLVKLLPKKHIEELVKAIPEDDKNG